MINQEQQKLQVYLSELEQALNGVTSTDRAEIILEIRSHVLDAKDSNPEARVEDILASFGKPEQVATRYLLEKGIKPVIKKKRSWFKLTCGGCLGLFLCIFFIIFILTKMFLPLVEISKGDEGKWIKMLGGMIKINTDSYTTVSATVEDGNNKISVKTKKSSMQTTKSNSSFTIGDTTYKSESYGGKIDSENKTLRINCLNCKITLKPNLKQEFAWQFEKDLNLERKDIITTATTMYADFTVGKDKTGNATFEVPAKSGIEITGENGTIFLDKIASTTNIKIDDGKVIITPDSDQKYHYTLKTSTGTVDGFESSNEADAIPVTITTSVGDIVKK